MDTRSVVRIWTCLNQLARSASVPEFPPSPLTSEAAVGLRRILDNVVKNLHQNTPSAPDPSSSFSSPLADRAFKCVLLDARDSKIDGMQEALLRFFEELPERIAYANANSAKIDGGLANASQFAKEEIKGILSSKDSPLSADRVEEVMDTVIT